jgi:putative ABC transport system ATP-binding protein
MPEPVAQLRRISRIYRKPGTDIEVAALNTVDLDLIKGEYTAIMGASGSGKSTLMNLLGCLDRPTTGSYILGDRDVSQLDDDALSLIRGKNIGFVFQNFNLIQQLTVLENLEVSMFYSFIPRAERRERAVRLATRVGLAERLDHRPNQLSGGQQQRVCIARALTNDPLILLADEPTGALDSKTGEQILGIFEELVANGVSVILVTHDPKVGERCQRVIRLADGNIISDVRKTQPV